MKNVTLYHGDNGCAEFWESENSEVLMERLHGRDFWCLSLKGKLVYFDRQHLKPKGAYRIENLAGMLLDDHKIHVQFNHTKEWVDQDMVLMPTS